MLARTYGTPLYIYSRSAIEENFQKLKAAFEGRPHLICYAVKANNNPAVLRHLASLGAGADVVSLGELQLALDAGIPAEKIVFAGVGKRDDEIQAGLRAGIAGFNVESEMEIEVIDGLAGELGVCAKIALRINPNIDIDGHPFISTGRHRDKFGISLETAGHLVNNFSRYQHTKLVGLHAHIGSQVYDARPYLQLGQALREFAETTRRAGHKLSYIDVGGGIGVDYKKAEHALRKGNNTEPFAFDPALISAALYENLGDLDCTIIMEPGRALVANAGILVTRVLFKKETEGTSFTIVDAGMSDLIRPSLYSAFHGIVPLRDTGAPEVATDIVGPICESTDFFAKGRKIPEVTRGDYLALLSTGAYGYTLSSNYNSRSKPAEVLVHGSHHELVRERIGE